MNAIQISLRASEFLAAKTSKMKLLAMMNKDENQDLLVAIMETLQTNTEFAKTIEDKLKEKITSK